MAAEIVLRLTDEVTAFAVTTLRRLNLTAEPVDVVLGGGLVRAASPDTIDRIVAGVREVAAQATVLVAPSAPIVGAALLGLDELGVNSHASARARAELDAAFARIEGDGARVAVDSQTPLDTSAQELLRSSRG